MTREEAKTLLDLVNNWETAAELHATAMRRNRGFAKEGEDLYDFYLAESAREEIRASLCRSHARSLRDLLAHMRGEESPNADDAPAGFEAAKNSATGL